jgi:hypothetical protein
MHTSTVFQENAPDEESKLYWVLFR